MAASPSGQPRPLVAPRRPVETIRVLVLLDRDVLAHVVLLALSHGDYLTRTAETVAEALATLKTWQPHLAVVNMDSGGGAFLQQVRGVTMAVGRPRLPVIALTRRGELKVALDAFERGVDDLLTVPLAAEELLARSRAVVRRSYGELPPVVPVIRRGALEIDILNRRVRAGEYVVSLTPLEQSLLYLLAANGGRVLTRGEIVDHLWGVDFVTESNVIDRHVRNLRTKLQDDWRAPRYIATVPGRGYRFLPESEEEPGTPTDSPRGAVSRVPGRQEDDPVT